eukprot:877445-Prymnesium_polylepis.1
MARAEKAVATSSFCEPLWKSANAQPDSLWVVFDGLELFVVAVCTNLRSEENAFCKNSVTTPGWPASEEGSRETPDGAHDFVFFGGWVKSSRLVDSAAGTG